MATKNDPKINLKDLSAEELHRLLEHQFKINYDKRRHPDHPRYPGGYQIGGVTMTEDRYQKMIKEQFDEKINKIQEFKGKKDALLRILEPLKNDRGNRFLPGYTTDYILKLNRGEEPTGTPVGDGAVTVSGDAGTEKVDIDPNSDLEEQLLERIGTASEGALKRNEYLSGLFGEFADVNVKQAISSSTANILNLGTNIFAKRKELNELTLPEFSIPGKDVIRLHRPNVKTSFDRLAGQVINTGIQQARDLGRPELIPSVLYQGQQIAEKGILEQGRIDTDISNKQSLVDLQLSEAFKGRQIQAESLKFKSEIQLKNARAGVYEAFGNNIKQNFAVQADILNKTLLNPIAVQVDWLDKYGYTSIYDKSL